jgi:hypothetical protein
VVQYALKGRPQEVKLEFLDSAGKLIREFSSKAPEAAPESPSVASEENPFRAQPAPRVPAAPGLNRFTWNMRYPDASTFPGLIMWAGNVVGPLASPGAYQVRLTVDGKSQTQRLAILKDPRLDATPDDYAKQLSLALQVRDKLSATNDAVIRIRAVRQQLDEFAKRDDKRVSDAAKALSAKLTTVEEDLYQTKNRASEDPLNFPIKLNNKLAYVMGTVESSDNAPTAQSYMVYEDVATRVNADLKTLDNLLNVDLAAFNKLVHDQGVAAVEAPKVR